MLACQPNRSPVFVGQPAAGGPVLGEWDIAVVGPHFAAALVARDLLDDGQDAGRTFDYVLTYDREIVLDVAGSPMARTLPVTASAPASVHGAARPP